MQEINSVAAMATGIQQARIETEVAMRTLKMANDQSEAVMELLLKTFQAAATGLGQYIDARA